MKFKVKICQVIIIKFPFHRGTKIGADKPSSLYSVKAHLHSNKGEVCGVVISEETHTLPLLFMLYPLLAERLSYIVTQRLFYFYKVTVLSHHGIACSSFT